MTGLDRLHRPPSRPLRDFDFPPVDRRVLANGLDLRVVRLARLPVVSAKLFIRAGEAALGAGQAGLCVLTGEALDGGTHRHTGADLAEALESIGARLSVGSGWEGTSVGLSCLADRLPEALGFLAEMILEPAFPKDEVDRAKEQHLAALRQREMDPASLAGDSALPLYFASGVPYARPVDGTTETVAALTRENLRGYVDANYKPEDGGLIIVGDVDSAEVEAMVRDRMGAWIGRPASTADFEVEPAAQERRIWIVDRPGSVQSEIRVGHVGVARDTPDYFALSVANLILGGMFTSRLNLNLREENGFTYGVRSRFTFRTKPGPFQVSTAVGNDVTAAAVREIITELERIAREGPTDHEVVTARDYAAGVFGLQLETAGQVATRVAQLVIYGLPDDYFDRYRDAVRSVGTAAATEAARRHIRPDEAQIVLVGDASVIAGSLEALDLGPVEVSEVE